MSKFYEGPMSDEFNKQGDIPKGGPRNTYDGCKDGPFATYPRTPGPNGEPEVAYDGTIPQPTGEDDQF